jgi:cold shock CspA family protein
MTENKTEKLTGKIIKLSDEGWGFITTPSIEFTRIFFHWSALVQDTLNFKELRRGMRVEFIPIELPDKGYRAIKIKVLTDEPTETK